MSGAVSFFDGLGPALAALHEAAGDARDHDRADLFAEPLPFFPIDTSTDEYRSARREFGSVSVEINFKKP